MLDQTAKENLIRETIIEAEEAIKEGNSPFGAVLVNKKGVIVAKAHNTQKSASDSTAHAEINLLRTACEKLKTINLGEYILFSNSESCPMCISAAIKAKIKTFYFGVPREISSTLDISSEEIASKAKEKINIEIGILENKCSEVIKKGRQF